MARTIEKAPAVAGVKLWIRNGAPYSRGGIVQVPWSVVAEAIPGLSVDDELEIAFGGSVVPAQVDVIQKTSDSAVVVFALPSVGAGDEHYHSKQSAVIRRRTQPSPGRRASAGEREGGVYFNNDELDVWFSLSERHGGSNQRGGAATTVQVNRFEVLDAGAASKHPFAGHDARKCAMQIDSIRMWRPPWDEYEPSYCDFSLAGQPWTLVASGGGAVRGWATLASPPFDFSFRDLTAPARCSYNCRLYRTISLFAGADYLIEDVAVRGAPVGFEGPRDLAFAPHYFMWSHFGLEAKITHYADIPDWFEQLDTDKDGQIGLYEWVKAGRSIDDFRLIDRNDDGFLTIEEVMGYVRNGSKNPGTAIASRPRTTSAMLAAANSATPTSARSSASMLQLLGRNSGSMYVAKNNTVISGTPRQNSMKVIENVRTIGSLERRPSASRMPSGSEATMPVTATTSVTSRPPHRCVST